VTALGQTCVGEYLKFIFFEYSKPLDGFSCNADGRRTRAGLKQILIHDHSLHRTPIPSPHVFGDDHIRLTNQ